MNNDLINRKQAIEVVQNRHMMLSKEKVLLINDLEKLPSAQPTFDARDTQYNLPIGTDLISRQAAIDTLENTKTAISENGERYIAKQNAIMRIDALPSAQPKKGKWISLDDFRGKYNENGYKCSECDEHSDYKENFCPNCGARMEVTE